MSFSRAHWRCEDETHWTADAELGEDRRRLAWSRHPNGFFVISALRMIALGILALARKLSRLGSSLETPTWQQVAEHFLLVLCDPVLDAGASTPPNDARPGACPHSFNLNPTSPSWERGRAPNTPSHRAESPTSPLRPLPRPIGDHLQETTVGSS